MKIQYKMILLVIGAAFLLFLDVKVASELALPGLPSEPRQTIVGQVASDTSRGIQTRPGANKALVQPSKKPILPVSVNPEGKTVIDLVNVERVKLGLLPLKENPKLDRAAQGKAEDMDAKQYWAHASPTGQHGWDWMQKEGYQFETAGENLAMDFATYPEAVAAWMKSPTHKANITDTSFTETGIGIKAGTYKGKPTVFIVQLFASPYVQ